MRLDNYLEHNILLTDGAMGTYYNQKYSGDMEAEEANLRYPDRILAIHKEYIEAGAKLIRTNTFAVNHTLFPDRSVCEKAFCSALDIARQAVSESGKDVAIAASIGPIHENREDADDAIWEEYRSLIDLCLEQEIDTFVFETFSDPKWISRLSEYCKEKCEHAFVIAQFSVNPMGYTGDGYSVHELIRCMEQISSLDAYGFNCGVGGAHLKKLLEKESFGKSTLLSVLPNAGYQQELRGRMRYSDKPDYYAKHMEELISLGVNIIGGCCGTTPDHIRTLSEMLKGKTICEKKIFSEETDAGQISGIQHLTPFMEKLNSGEKVFVVELDAPFDAKKEKFEKGIYALKENRVDIITVSDSPLARARADASLLAVYAKHIADVEIMPHVAMRDRNLIGLRSEVLGAHVNGIRDLLVITGDPVGRDDRGKITGVFDMNSIRFMDYLKHMNEEVFGNDPIYYGGALNYDGPNINAIISRMTKKMEAGCSYFLTQPVFSEGDIERIRELKQSTGAKIICGIMPIVSYRNALFMQNEMPGIHIDDTIVAKYKPDMSREDAEAVAIEVSVEIAGKLADIADGYYIMTPFHRVELVVKIMGMIREITGGRD